MKQVNISFEKKLIELSPNISLGLIYYEVEVGPSVTEFVKFRDDLLSKLSLKFKDVDSIKHNEYIKATREAYKTFGKDPSRYRPSAEALLRRVIQGKGLFDINNVVDFLNLLSSQTGYSICGYDVSSITGDVKLGIGKSDEYYEGIGRGELNISGLPVFRDEKGAFGTPTSDSPRTMVTEGTKDFLMILMDFSGCENLVNVIEQSKELNFDDRIIYKKSMVLKASNS